MSDFTTELLTTVTAAALWGSLTAAAGLVGVAVIFAFGYRVIRRAIGGVSRGKAKV